MMTTPAFMKETAESNLIFFDDFSLGRLDRSKWNVRTTGKVVNNEQQAYIDSAETIYIASEEQVAGANRGALVLQARYQPNFISPEGDRFDFVSGRIDTRDKFDFRYGSAAARMMLPAGSGLWPAFWLHGYGQWPASGEIDVMEYVGERDWVSSAVHGPNYFGEAGLVNKLFFSNSNDATAWHVYTVDWRPDSLIFKVDGQVVYRVTRQMTDFFGPWVFDNHKFFVLNFALGGVYPFKTNGLRSPYYGIAQETVDKIRKNQAKVMIDWIRVLEM